MKPIFTLFFLLFTFLASANDLIGSWSNCTLEEDGTYSEHFVKFGKDNTEFELNAFYEKSDIPCKGKPLLAVGRYWHYLASSDELHFTLFSTYIVVVDKSLVKALNEEKTCGRTDWVESTRLECETELYGEKRGFKTNFTYKIVGDELLVTDKDGTMVFQKTNKK